MMMRAQKNEILSESEIKEGEGEALTNLGGQQGGYRDVITGEVHQQSEGMHLKSRRRLVH